MKAPKIGDVIYIRPNDDTTGGRAIVSDVRAGFSSGRSCIMVSVECRPGWSANWDFLGPEQSALRLRYGFTVAHLDDENLPQGLYSRAILQEEIDRLDNLLCQEIDMYTSLKVGDIIYVDADDDCTAGLAVVSKVLPTADASRSGAMIEVEVNPSTRHSWNYLFSIQHMLKQSCGDKRARQHHEPPILGTYSCETLQREIDRLNSLFSQQ